VLFRLLQCSEECLKRHFHERCQLPYPGIEHQTSASKTSVILANKEHKIEKNEFMTVYNCGDLEVLGQSNHFTHFFVLSLSSAKL